MERRNFPDRRRQPTTLFSRYTLWGRRKALRRKGDQQQGGYVDRYGPGLLFLIVLIAGLNILDSFLTMIILESGGWEMNPIVRSAIEVYGDKFWVYKFMIVSVNLILLCLHSKFRHVNRLIFWLSLLFLGVIIYQIILLHLYVF
jgi:hypothetical protein